MKTLLSADTQIPRLGALRPSVPSALIDHVEMLELMETVNENDNQPWLLSESTKRSPDLRYPSAVRLNVEASALSVVRTASPPLEILMYRRARLRYLVGESTPMTKLLGSTGMATNEVVVAGAEVVLALVEVVKLVMVLVVVSTELVVLSTEVVVLSNEVVVLSNEVVVLSAEVVVLSTELVVDVFSMGPWLLKLLVVLMLLVVVLPSMGPWPKLLVLLVVVESTLVEVMLLVVLPSMGPPMKLLLLDEVVES